MIQLVNNSLWSELPKIQSKLSSHEVSEIKRRKRECLGPCVIGLPSQPLFFPHKHKKGTLFRNIS